MVQELQLSPDTHVLIRVARPADAASLIAHRRRSCAGSCFLAFYPDEISDDVEAQARIIEAAGEDPHRAILAATTGDEVIGFAGYLPAGPGAAAPAMGDEGGGVSGHRHANEHVSVRGKPQPLRHERLLALCL